MDGQSASAEDHPLQPSGAHGAGESVDAEGFALTVYLCTDLRSFTQFTTQRGADAAAGLANRFADVVTEVVAVRHGHVKGTWGDEVLAEFGSARDAVRAALMLQERCGDATVEDPTMPLGAGVGLDVGESSSTGSATSGSALNVASRLCALAEAGECLTTQALAHLAGQVDGVTFEPRGKARLKGVGRVAVIRLRPTAADSRRAAQLRALWFGTQEQRTRVRRQRSLLAALVVAALVLGMGAWWLGHRQPGSPAIPAQSVGVIDTASGSLLGSVSVGESPEGVAASPMGTWVVNAGSDSVSRIDPATRAVVQTTDVGSRPVAVAAQGPYVWVVNSGSGSVSVVSTQTNGVVDTVDVGNEPSSIAAGRGALWVTNQADASVTRIDATPDARGHFATSTIRVGDSPDGIAVGDGAVWVSNRGTDTVSRIDPANPDAAVPIPVGAGPRGIVATKDGVWVANSLELTVSYISYATSTADAPIPVGDTPTALAAGPDAVWVSVAGAAAVARIDIASHQVRSWFVGSSPRGLALVGDQLWVAGQGYGGAGHRGGTLTVADRGGRFDTIDPAQDYMGYFVPLMYDALVSPHLAEGAQGNELVPDLATRLPVPTDGGKTYWFTLRRGIRYSDGRPVLASDLLRGLERQFWANVDPKTGTYDGYTPVYYDGIVGAAACVRRAATCDLRVGVLPDDRTGTLRIRLTQPDPDFLGKISLRNIVPAPPGTPHGAVGNHPLVGTGPYMMTEYDAAAGTFTLVRNPYFHQWSSAAQPDGYPDVIRWTEAADRAAATTAVEQGRADISFPETEDVRALVARYPGRVKAGISNATQMVVLNPNVPPFNNLKARQAAAYALSDDPTMARDFDGQPVCRLVPPSFSGHSPGCPYPRSLDRARSLLRESGMWGARVNVYSVPDPHFAGPFHYVAARLHSAGFDAHAVTEDPYRFWVADKTRAMNAEGMQWAPDFPAASQYYALLLGCDDGVVLPFLCDKRLDTLARQAWQAQLSDANDGERLWRDLYARLDADARIIPTNDQTFHHVFVGARVGNFLSSPLLGLIIDQFWVR